MAIGGVTVAGGLLLATAPSECDEETLCLFDNKDLGTAITLVGVAMFMIGAIGQFYERPAFPPSAAMSHAPPAPFPTEPAIEAPRPPPMAPLPASGLMYPSPADRQFALQASAAARRGDCRAAKVTATQLSVDIRHRLATVDEAFARCQQ